ncbi:hypothetical protein CBM2623_A10115 [Cupriavidus taiwanensis]|nr:hypothetical protein CBM2623_A10115 [Cupriavidus taiwanensis]
MSRVATSSQKAPASVVSRAKPGPAPQCGQPSYYRMCGNFQHTPETSEQRGKQRDASHH